MSQPRVSSITAGEIPSYGQYKLGWVNGFLPGEKTADPGIENIPTVRQNLSDWRSLCDDSRFRWRERIKSSDFPVPISVGTSLDEEGSDSMFILLLTCVFVSCLIVYIWTYRYNNNLMKDWLKRLSLFVFFTPLILIMIIFFIKQNYQSYNWLIRQDCWFCTGSGPGLLSVFLKLSFMSFLGLVSYWIVEKNTK